MIYLILLVGFLLRVISLNQSLWLDEATTAMTSNMTINDLMTKFLPGDFHPPLYYLFLNFWVRVFGSSEIALRLPSVIFGVLTIYVVYKIAEITINKKTGILAATLLAVSGIHVYYSQEARMYSLAALFVSLAFYFFMKILHGKRVGDFVFFGLSITLAVLTDYLPFLMLPVFWIVAAIVQKNYSWWKKFITSHIILLLGFGLWIPTFINQLHLGLNVRSSLPAWWNVLGKTNFKNLALVPVKFILGRISFDDRTFYSLIAIVSISIFLYLIYLARKKVLEVWLWLLIPATLTAILGFWVPVLTYFRLLFILPAAFILVSYGLSSLDKKGKSYFVKIVPLGLLLATVYYLFTPRFYREDWRNVAGNLGEEMIVFPSHSQHEGLIYYGAKEKIVTKNRLDLLADQIWLSRYVWEVVDPNDITRVALEKLGYKKFEEKNFNGVVIWHYRK